MQCKLIFPLGWGFLFLFDLKTIILVSLVILRFSAVSLKIVAHYGDVRQWFYDLPIYCRFQLSQLWDIQFAKTSIMNNCSACYRISILPIYFMLQIPRCITANENQETFWCCLTPGSDYNLLWHLSLQNSFKQTAVGVVFLIALKVIVVLVDLRQWL